MADSQRGNVARFPSPHLRHFPERISAVRVGVLEASGRCEACACRMSCSFVVLGTRPLVGEGEGAGGRHPRAVQVAAVSGGSRRASALRAWAWGWSGEVGGSGLPRLLCLSRCGGRVRGRDLGAAWWVGEGVGARLRLVARSRHYKGGHFLSDPGVDVRRLCARRRLSRLPPIPASGVGRGVHVGLGSSRAYLAIVAAGGMVMEGPHQRGFVFFVARPRVGVVVVFFMDDL